ncbi:MAG: septum formation initiator family protein [Prevotellaceae bacterium]|jgi:cell division protein FtsB|nr:septum formation initiator family protein [Prevotellaceae bacterium]
MNKKFLKYCKNRRMITVVIFMTWVMFFDDISIPKWVSQKRNTKNILEQIETLENKTKELEERLKYKNNRDTIEKFARENYYMKRNNEVIYIFD